MKKMNAQKETVTASQMPPVFVFMFVNASNPQQPHIVPVHKNHPMTPEYREQVYHYLAESLIKALNHANPDVFSLEDSEQSAEYVIHQLEKAATKEELFHFLKQLSDVWPVYHSVYSKLQKAELMSKVDAELKQMKGETE